LSLSYVAVESRTWRSVFEGVRTLTLRKLYFHRLEGAQVHNSRAQLDVQDKGKRADKPYRGPHGIECFSVRGTLADMRGRTAVDAGLAIVVKYLTTHAERE